MALKDKWIDRVEEQDICSADDINMVANAVVELEDTVSDLEDMQTGCHDCEVVGEYGFATGDQTKVGWRSLTAGYMTEATNTSHSEGRLSKATGKGSHAEGVEVYYAFQDKNGNDVTVVLAEDVHIDQDYIVLNAIPYTMAVGEFLILGHENNDTFATDAKKIVEIDAEGNRVRLSAPFRALNYDESNTKNGDGIISAGSLVRWAVPTKALGRASHGEGGGCVASGVYSHAENQETIASGAASHAEGYRCKATKDAGHAEGDNTEATAIAAHTEGGFTVANRTYQHVQGRHNVPNADMVHIVGWGTASQKKNIHTIDTNGNAYFSGGLTLGNVNVLNKIAALEARIAELENR